jgi:hypothetical protein
VRGITPKAVVLAALLCVGVGVPDALGRPATLSGKVPGGAPKLGGHVVSTVTAVNPATARVVGVRSLTRTGRYSLKVPPGPVLVLARVVRRTGKPKVTSSRIAKVRSGQRKRVKVTRKRPRLRRRHHRALASQGITVDLVKVSTFGSTLTGGRPGADSRALEGMMDTEVYEAGQRAPCDVELYADRDSPEFKAIEAEIALQQSPLVDPSTRVVPRYKDPRYQPTARVQAHLTLGADGDTVTGEVVAKEKNGNVHGRSVSGTFGGFFFQDGQNAFRSALDDIFKELCGAGLSEISGTFSGSSTISGRTNYRWNGSVVFKRQVENVPGAFGNYPVSSGLVTYTASGLSPTAACQVSGTKQFNIPANGGSIGVAGSPPQGLEPYTYSISVPAPFPGSMEVTWSSCSDPSANGLTETISVGGDALMSGSSEPSEHGLLYQGSYDGSQFGAHWDWALEGR